MASYSVCSPVPDPDSVSAATLHISNQRHAQRDSEFLTTTRLDVVKTILCSHYIALTCL